MVTVSIVTYKTDLGELRKCLDSLASPSVSKIYIVDNSNQKYIADFYNGQEKVEYIGSNNAVRGLSALWHYSS